MLTNKKRRITLHNSALISAAITLFGVSIALRAEDNLDKYLKVTPESIVKSVTKEELIELLRRQYNRSGQHGIPDLSVSEENAVAVANVLTSEHDVHCSPANSRFPENYSIAVQVLSALNSIIEIQYGRESARKSLLNSVNNIGSQCRESIEDVPEVKALLAELTAESERWYQARTRAKEMQNQAESKRIDALRQGKAEEIRNFNDAMIFYSAGNGRLLMARPKIKPDSRLYGAYGAVLDRVEQGGDTLIIRAGSPPNYAFITGLLAVKQHRSVIENLRIGMPIHVIGRYVKNTEYSTVLGAAKTAVVLEAVYISPN